MPIETLLNNGTLDMVRIGNSITYGSMHDIGEHIKSVFSGLIDRVKTSHLETPPVPEMRALFLTNVLHERYSGHVLGLTDAELMTEGEFYNSVFGGKNAMNDVAVVSTRMLSFGDEMTEEQYHIFIRRVTNVALHELGHNYSLTDHPEFRVNGKGTLCPMSRGKFNSMGVYGYIKGVIDERGEKFCSECSFHLKKLVRYRGYLMDKGMPCSQ